jgi:NitT/TauT family transport system substrate-binding protein
MRKCLKWILVTVIIVVGVVAIVSCQPTDTDQTPEIRIGFNTWVGYGPFYIAQEKGFFSKRGLNVDLQRIEGTGDRRSALIAGRLDGMGSTVDDLVIGAAQGVTSKMVLGLDESAGADGILTVEDVTTVADFKGKTIAVQPGFVNHFFLLYILDDHGLSSADVEVKPMDPDKASAAFVAGDVDIAVTWEPHLSQVQDFRSDGKTFLTSSDYQGLIVDILAFNADFIDQNPDEVAAFVDAWYEAMEFLEANPDEAHEIIGGVMDLDPAEVADILTGVKFLGQEDNLQYHDRNQAVNVFSIASTASRIWQAEGFIDTPVDTDNLIDTRFLNGSE